MSTGKRGLLANFRTPFRRRLGNQRGNLLLQTVLLLGILSAGIYFLVEQVNTQKRVILETDGVMKARFTLHSLLDYMLFGLRQKYCFSTGLVQDVCSLGHPASSERIMMSELQADLLKVQLLKDSATAPFANKLRLKKIQILTPFNRIAITHPLFGLVQQLDKQIKGGHFKVNIDLEEGLHVSRSGQEVYLKVTGAVTDSKGDVLVLDKSRAPLSLTSYVTVYPREMGTFGLVVAQDLHLDLPFDHPFGPGDSGIHLFTSTSGRAFPSGGKGLHFLSPVFVNRNLYVPTPDSGGSRSDGDKRYSPVTFGDRVYLGNGSIMEGSSPYLPITAGGPKDAYWADNKLFGGFQAGISVDGAFDKGLQVFSGNLPSEPADASLMETCIRRAQALSDVNVMKRSQLFGNIQGSTATTADYRIGLTEGNSILPQGNVLHAVTYAQWKGAYERGPAGADTRDAVVHIVVIQGSRRIEAQVPKPGLFIVRPEPGSVSYKKKLEKDLKDAQKLAPPNPAAVDAAQAKLDEFNVMATTQRPELKITVKETKIADKGPQPHLLDISFEMLNPKSFIVDDGTLVSPIVDISAYDGTYLNSYPIGSVNTKLSGRFPILIDPAGVITFPAGAFSSSTNAPKDIPNDDTDYFSLDEKCEAARGGADSQSFGGAAWNTDFSGQTRVRSWNFAGNSGATHADPLVNEMILGGSWSASPAAFKVRSIVGTCRIPGSSELVTGFYTCDRLIIEQRPKPYKPLRIIGTFIVGQMQIHPTALEAGIRWSSIYHPQATVDLRTANVLAPKTPGANCNVPPKDAAGKTIPPWFSAASLKNQQNQFSCNAVSLREKGGNFRWTAMDPDCGIRTGDSNTTCKNRQTQFLLVEHARGGGI